MWLGFLAGLGGMLVTTRAWSYFNGYAIPLFLGCAYLLLTYGLGLKNFHQPVFAISPGAIEHWRIPTLVRRRVRAGEGFQVEKSSPRRLVLRAASGKRISLRLDWLSKADRSEARAAIERWVEDYGSSAG
jgi:hypothetical protein